MAAVVAQMRLAAGRALVLLLASVLLAHRRPALAVNVARLAGRPAVYRVTDFASAETCAYLKQFAAPHLKPSKTRQDTGGEARKSESYWLSRADMDDVVIARVRTEIEQMMAMIAAESNKISDRGLHVFPVDPDLSEVFQITRYTAGEYYKAHSDYIDDSPGYDRIATFLL